MSARTARDEFGALSRFASTRGVTKDSAELQASWALDLIDQLNDEVDRLRALLAEPPARQAVIDAACAERARRALGGGLFKGTEHEPGWNAAVFAILGDEADAMLRGGRDTPTPDPPPKSRHDDSCAVWNHGQCSCPYRFVDPFVPVQVPTPQEPHDWSGMPDYDGR